MKITTSANMKRMLSLFAVSLLAAIISLPTMADNVLINGLYYSFSGNYANVEPKSSVAADQASYVNGNITIPAKVTYSGKTYTVNTISRQAFANCTNLKEVTIEDNKFILTIMNQAFKNSGITKLTIKNSTVVQFYDDEHFYLCSKLSEVSFEPGCMLTFQNYDNSAPQYTFATCTALKSITLPAKTSNFPMGMFYNCGQLETVQVGNAAYTDTEAMTSIGDNAFSGCGAMKTLYLLNTVAPTISSTSLSGLPSSAKALVPCNAVSNYSGSNWNKVNVDGLFEYSFDIKNADSSMGSISVLKYPDCTDHSAEIAAYPYAGYAFEAWYDNKSNTVYSYQAKTTIANVSSDMNLTAHFVKSDCSTNGVFPYQFNVTTEDAAKGSVSVLKAPDCDDTSAEIAAYPYAGYAFEAWYDNKTNTVYSYQAKTTIANVSSDMSLTAHFVKSDCSTNGVFPYQFNVTTEDAVKGSVSVLKAPDCENPSARAYARSNANSGYVFMVWSDGSTENPRYWSEVTEHVNISAIFTQGEHGCDKDGIFPYMFNVFTDNELFGSVEVKIPTCEDPSARVYARPNTGYEFLIWSDGTTANPRTWTEVTSDVNMAAFFKEKNHGCQIDGILGYMFIIKPNDYNMGTTMMTRVPDCADPTTQIAAIAKEGYEFVRWSDGDKNATRQITVSGDTYLQALFQDPEQPISDGLEEVLDSHTSRLQGAEKVLVDGVLYLLLPDGSRYDATGRKVE